MVCSSWQESSGSLVEGWSIPSEAGDPRSYSSCSYLGVLSSGSEFGESAMFPWGASRVTGSVRQTALESPPG